MSTVASSGGTRRFRGRSRTPAGRKSGPNPFLVAAVTILLAAAITYWAFDGKQIPFVHHFTVYALVGNSVDITSGSPVRIAGVNVGQVTGTSADGGMTKIAFTLSSNGLPMHTDSTVTIRDRLFLEGAYYLALDPGSPSAPIAKDGFTIGPSNTSYPVQFYNVLSTFNLPVRQSLANALYTLNEGLSPSGFTANGEPTSSSGAAGLKETVPQLAPTLEDVAWITQGLRGTQPGDVGRLLSSSADVTTTLRNSSAQLANLITGLDQVSSALTATDGSLAESVSGLDKTLQVAPPALSALDHALPPVTNLARALGPSLKASPPLLDGLDKAVRELAAVLAPAERTRLLTVLKATFEQLPGTLTRLGSAFATVKPVTDCLRTHVEPILNAVVPDGSLSTGESVWKDFAHALVGLSGAAGDFDGNGYWLWLGGVTDLGLSVGNITGIGKVLALTPTSQGVAGVRPQWQGPLTSDDFQPGASCADQPVPSLQASAGPSDFTRHVAQTAPLSTAQLTRLADRLLGSHALVAAGG